MLRTLSPLRKGRFMLLTLSRLPLPQQFELHVTLSTVHVIPPSVPAPTARNTELQKPVVNPTYQLYQAGFDAFSASWPHAPAAVRVTSVWDSARTATWSMLSGMITHTAIFPAVLYSVRYVTLVQLLALGDGEPVAAGDGVGAAVATTLGLGDTGAATLGLGVSAGIGSPFDSISPYMPPSPPPPHIAPDVVSTTHLL